MCSGNYSSSIRKNIEKREPYNSPYNSKFVNELREFIPFLKEAKFYGGEPFLIKTYYDFWDSMLSLNPSINILIQTNATVLNERIKALLERGKFSINVSIESMVKESYELIRKKASFEEVMSNIEYFIAYTKSKGTYFSLVACPMQQNWKEIPHLIERCNEMGVPLGFNTVSNPIRCSLMTLSSEELKKICNFLSAQNFSVNNKVEIFNKQAYLELVSQVKLWLEQSEKRGYHINNSEEFFLVNRLEEYLSVSAVNKEEEYLLITSKLNSVVSSLQNKEGFDLTLFYWKLNQFDISDIVENIKARTIEDLSGIAFTWM